MGQPATPDERRRAYKNAWQRRQRAAFAAEHGYSTTAAHGARMNRAAVLERDGYACVKCGMTDAQHKARWGRPITIDHIDKNRKNNELGNLQTLCLICHGRKDITPRLIEPKVSQHKEDILAWRAAGETYERIAQRLGVTPGKAIWKWVKRWEQETRTA